MMHFLPKLCRAGALFHSLLLLPFPILDGAIPKAMPEAMNEPEVSPVESAITLGGGCFWCLEAIFQNVVGVTEVTSGYAGGHTPDPDYRSVCSGTTGHAEVVQIRFDPNRVTLETIFEIFWDIHDPTTLNRQGADVGTQYRSIILYHSESQGAAARSSLARAQSRWADPITTELVPLARFFRAEEEHQNYFRRHPEVPYCAIVIAPNLEKFLRSRR